MADVDGDDRVDEDDAVEVKVAAQHAHRVAVDLERALVAAVVDVRVALVITLAPPLSTTPRRPEKMTMSEGQWSWPSISMATPVRLDASPLCGLSDHPHSPNQQLDTCTSWPCSTLMPNDV